MALIKGTKDNFEAEVLKAEGIVVVDFGANWCGPCKSLVPILDEVVEEAKNYQLFLENLTISPIKGTKGNIEYLAKFSKKDKLSNKEIINKIDKLFND